jgi:transcriptional regulator with XRE-family HTH domain
VPSGLPGGIGRIAQRESTRLTSERSQVQILLRPPSRRAPTCVRSTLDGGTPSRVSLWAGVQGMVESTIGERLRELRRGIFTQHDLAAAADVSVDVIRKLEQGRRHTASIATLARIADALGVDLAELLRPARPLGATSENKGQVSAIADVLTGVDDLLGELDDADLPDLTELGRAVTYAWGHFYAGRYGSLAVLLPRLLADAQAATHAAAASDSARVADLAAQVHQITAGTLVRLDAADLGHVAAREALRLAASGTDPLRAASGRYTFGHVLMRQGRFIDAERVSVATAEQVQPTGPVSAAQLTVYGGLLLRGATAAARQGRAHAATDLLAEATTVAERAGMDRVDRDVVFGPSNLVMQSTDCSVVVGDYVRAADVARLMPREAALPLMFRSRHLADVAHAQLRLGRTQAAESTLLTMERAAPEWTTHHRLPRLLVGELLTRGRPSARLRELSQRLNVTRRT